MQPSPGQPGESPQPPPLTIAAGGRTVLLRHETPDGDEHFDWLLESVRPENAVADDPDQRSLLAFRLAVRLDQLAPGKSLEALRIEGHRRLYLEYEGAVAGSRGCVRRIAAGHVHGVRQVSPLKHALTVRWQSNAGGPQREQSLHLTAVDSGSKSLSSPSARYLLRCAAAQGAAQ